MKKRIVALALAIAVTCSLAGCGGGDGNSSASKSGGESEKPYEATMMYLVANDARDVDSVLYSNHQWDCIQHCVKFQRSGESSYTDELGL